MKESLTAREREIVELVKLGKGNAEIGEDLGISIDTVKRHLTNILQKTGSRNRIELASRGNDMRGVVAAFDQLSSVGAYGARSARWYRPTERKPPANVVVRTLVRTHVEGSLHEIEAMYADGKFSVRVGAAYEDLVSFVLAWTPALETAQTRNALPESTRDQVRAAMQRCRGNKVQAAKILGVNRSTLYGWLGRMEIGQ